MQWNSASIEETERIAERILRKLEKSPKKNKKSIVVGLSGDLGSGKTAFVKSIAQILGIRDMVTSPTFVIEKRYGIPQPSVFTRMVHIDAYRLADGGDLSVLGWDELLEEPGNLVFIEWPELVAEALPQDMPVIRFEFVDDTTRFIDTGELK